MKTGNYIVSKHVRERAEQRGVPVDEIRWAVLHPRSLEEHGDPPRRGGTSWRGFGLSSDGCLHLAVGVELFADERGHAAALCTVSPPRAR